MSEWTLDSTADEIEEALEVACHMFLLRDRWLLMSGANERSMTHKFAEYLQPIFEPWNVDCEYDRDGYDRKRMPDILWKQKPSIEDTDASTVFPDIIIHRRGTTENLLVLEAKKNGKDRDIDFAKLQAFKDPTSHGYRHAYFLDFTTRDDGDVEFERVD